LPPLLEPAAFAPPSLARLLFGWMLIAASVAWLFIIPLLPLRSSLLLPTDLPVPAQIHHALLFFGYPGCTTVCPTALRELAQAHTQAPGRAQRAVLFISVMDEVHPTITQAYAHDFHPDFIGCQWPTSQRQAWMQRLGVSAYPLQIGEWEHSSFVYLLQRSPQGWILTHVFPASQQHAETLRLALTKLAQLPQK